MRTMETVPFRRNVMLGDQTMTVYSIGWIAMLTRRSSITIRVWERKGWIPKPILDGQIPDFRFYTPGEIIGYSRIVNSFPHRNGTRYPPEFKIELHAFHAKLKKAMQKQPGSLVLKLSNEQELLSAIKNNQDANQKRIARILAPLK